MMNVSTSRPNSFHARMSMCLAFSVHVQVCASHDFIIFMKIIYVCARAHICIYVYTNIRIVHLFMSFFLLYVGDFQIA